VDTYHAGFVENCIMKKIDIKMIKQEDLVVKVGAPVNVLESGSGLKSLKLSSRKEGYCIVSKSIALPERYPFDVSDESFSIRWKRRTERAKEEEIRGIMARRERQVKRVEEISPRDAVREAVGSTGKSSIQITQAGGSTVLADTGVNVQSVGLTGTYYIYSFDGKLLAEYNGLGELMREYIYVGDRLLAEYQPQSNQLYYYTTDQVNSVRVVTNQGGVRVSAGLAS
jgi:hypothetical protein